MARHYDKWARRQELDAYRVYDADLDEFPITVDRYAEQVYVCVYSRRGERVDGGRIYRSKIGLPGNHP